LRVLVTGAAGYIGSILTAELISSGYEVVALDNLEQGHRQAFDTRAIFVKCDLRDQGCLEEVIGVHHPEAVIHLAAVSNIEESFREPERYFRVNIVYGLHLLSAMLRQRVDKMVFSSTAAVYGEPVALAISEEHPKEALSPYGESKLIFERLLHWYARAYGMKFISLRYFNAAGATATLGEDHRPETHLIPNVLKVASGQEDRVTIYGKNYDTPDGSCVRDYIHVLDIARAHILALEALDGKGSQTYNLGSGNGYSVLEVVKTAKEVTGIEIPVTVVKRRRGDPAQLVANPEKIQRELGWQRRYPDLKVIIASAWEWHKAHPDGYTE